VAPLALLALVFGRKKKRGKWDGLLIALVMVAAVGMSLTACTSPTTTTVVTPAASATIITTPTPNGTVQATATITPTLPAPSATPTATSTFTCTATATTTSTPDLDEYGITFEGSWSENEKEIVLTTITAVGQKLAAFLGDGSSISVFVKVYGTPFRFYRVGGTYGSCEGGYHLVTCYSSATINERLLAHELGHSFQHSINGVNTQQPTPTPDKGPYYDLGKAAITDNQGNWVTGTHPGPGGVFERTIQGYKSGGIPDMYHGPEDWSDWNSNENHTARNEDFADMFMNWVFDSFSNSTSDKDNEAGIRRYNWVQYHMPDWISLATR
jgi:hypothetical protein